MAIGVGMRDSTERLVKKTGILLVSLGAKHARPENIELAIARAEGICSTLLVCALDTAEIINRGILFGEDEDSARKHLDEIISTLESASRTCSGRIPVKFMRMSDVLLNPSFSKYESLVRLAYEEDGAFQRHVDNQTFRNLQPLLIRRGVRRRNDPRIPALAQYLLLELALIFYVSEEGVADIQLGNEPEMGVVDSVFSGKYSSFQGAFRKRIQYKTIGQDLVLEHLAFNYSTFTITDLNMSIPAGCRFGIVGPNGSGKTTVLKLIGGHLPSAKGCIYLGDLELTRQPPGQRPTATVFQDLALFPHLNVLQNIKFGAKYKRGLRTADATQLAKDWSSRLDLVDYEESAPRNLSIGCQQRVAIARALAIRPAILLLDEPTASLDSEQKQHLATILRRACQEGWASTVILVTHDFDFALKVCDYIAVFDKGRLLIIDRPTKIQSAPPTGRIAELFGFFDVLHGRLLNDDTFLIEPGGLTVPVSADCQKVLDVPSCLLISPDRVRIGLGREGDTLLNGRVEDVAWTGNNLFVAIRTDVGIIRVISGAEAPRMRAGDEVQISFSSEEATVVPFNVEFAINHLGAGLPPTRSAN